MKRSAIVGAAIFLGACALAAPLSSGLPVKLVQGDQLKLWGVEANHSADGITISGQVDRTALPRGPLREHVHVETLDATGQVLSVQDAGIYPVTALRSRGTARLSSNLPPHIKAQDVNLQLRVVEGIPHG